MKSNVTWPISHLDVPMVVLEGAQDLERRFKWADKKQNLERLKPNLERRSKSS